MHIIAQRFSCTHDDDGLPIVVPEHWKILDKNMIAYVPINLKFYVDWSGRCNGSKFLPKDFEAHLVVENDFEKLPDFASIHRLAQKAIQIYYDFNEEAKLTIAPMNYERDDDQGDTDGSRYQNSLLGRLIEAICSLFDAGRRPSRTAPEARINDVPRPDAFDRTSRARASHPKGRSEAEQPKA